MKLKLVYWIATIVLCLGYLGGGLFYLFKTADAQAMYPQLGYPAYLVLLMGPIKLLGALAILTRLRVWISDLAYAGMFFHLPLAFSAHMGSGVPGWQPSVVMFACLLISFFTQNAVRKGMSPYAGARWGVAA
jgi:hypothetical protein